MEGTLGSSTGKSYLMINEINITTARIIDHIIIIGSYSIHIFIFVGCWSEPGSEYLGFGTTCRKTFRWMGRTNVPKIITSIIIVDH